MYTIGTGGRDSSLKYNITLIIKKSNYVVFYYILQYKRFNLNDFEERCKTISIEPCKMPKQ